MKTIVSAILVLSFSLMTASSAVAETDTFKWCGVEKLPGFFSYWDWPIAAIGVVVFSPVILVDKLATDVPIKSLSPNT